MTDLRARLEAARRRTLEILRGIDDEAAHRAPHPDFSPIAWHAGHIAYTEARWLLEYAQGQEDLSEPFAERFSQERSIKARRGELCPPMTEILEYMAQVRCRVLASLDRIEARLVWVVLQHEYQHCETVAVVAYLAGGILAVPKREAPRGRALSGFVSIEGGRARLGSDARAPWAYDNERPERCVDVAPFELARAPVTAGEWRAFVEAGGTAPRSWLPDGRILTPCGPIPFDPDLPVFGVSQAQAEAYARACGARLPTEEEWEWAARGAARRTYPWGEADPAGAPGSPPRCDYDLHYGGPAPVGAHPVGDTPEGVADLAGGVWEWTQSTFRPHPGFEPWPYRGYSVPYFDGKHAVLRGGSFATRGTIVRAAFRNWYPPAVREIFSGVRLAR